MATDVNKAGMVLRAAAAIGVISSVVWVFWFQKGGLGYSAYSSGTVENVAAGTNPVTFVSSVVGIALFPLLMKTELRVGEFHISPLWRRYAAFLVDFWFCLFIFANVSVMIPLLLEARRNTVKSVRLKEAKSPLDFEPAHAAFSLRSRRSSFQYCWVVSVSSPRDGVACYGQGCPHSSGAERLPRSNST